MPHFSHSILVFAAAALIGSSAFAASPIPYPDAQAAAAVSESSISKIREEGLVVGNGETNAIIYSAGNDLHLRISKNDCWDMRVFTQDDPPLPVVNIAARKAVGAHGNAGSWTHPYPTALPVAEVVLGTDGQTDVTGATLDLARAVDGQPMGRPLPHCAARGRGIRSRHDDRWHFIVPHQCRSDLPSRTGRLV